MGTDGWQANGATFVAWTWDAGSSTASNTDGTSLLVSEQIKLLGFIVTYMEMVHRCRCERWPQATSLIDCCPFEMISQKLVVPVRLLIR